MKLYSLPNWTLGEYHREFAGTMEVKRFGTISFHGKNLVIHNQNCFKCGTALGAWKRC